MKRKTTDGAIKNKVRTRKKILTAVGKLLKSKGFYGLKINHIAEVAGVDKKLIYDYFGGTDKLIDEYISTQDFWSTVEYKVDEIDQKDGGRALSKALLLSQFDYVFQNKELQKIILWGLSEKRKSLQNVAKKREEAGEIVFQNICDPHFGDKATLYRAISALLVSGIYYLDIYATSNQNTFCGLDIGNDSDRRKVKEAISYIIDQAYLII